MVAAQDGPDVVPDAVSVEADAALGAADAALIAASAAAMQAGASAGAASIAAADAVSVADSEAAVTIMDGAGVAGVGAFRSHSASTVRLAFAIAVAASIVDRAIAADIRGATASVSSAWIAKGCLGGPFLCASSTGTIHRALINKILCNPRCQGKRCPGKQTTGHVMFMKRVATVAITVLAVCVFGKSFAASAVSPGAASIEQSARANANSTLLLVKKGRGGGGFKGGGKFSGGKRYKFSGHGYRRRRGFGFYGAPFLVAPLAYGYYEGPYYGGGSCYARCRQYRGPGYCRSYAADYC